MELHPEHITIAVTVFSRREFVCDAIRSALDQTLPVQVIVVEDCGPDATLQEFITREFGSRIRYFRNPKNRGLFGNWNACMEYCPTPWLSILHDDDLLRPNFVETMISLAGRAPQRALYFGRAAHLATDGRTHPVPPVTWPGGWRNLDPVEFAEECTVLFPGQLFRVTAARELGGFRPASYFTGDWDMWFRLAVRFGAAQSATEVSVNRSHEGADRGTSRVERMGWKWALDNVQRKRNLALLNKEKGVNIPFDRTKLLKTSPIPSRLLWRHRRRFTRRILNYNTWLFLHSKPPHWRYAALQWLAWLCGPEVLRVGFHFRRLSD